MPQYRTIFRPTQSVDAPYVAENNYRLTRAMWFALYAPDSGRHDALLAEDVPDVYRRLFDAILDGSAGLARVALAGGDTNVWEGPLVLSITALGEVAPGKAFAIL